MEAALYPSTHYLLFRSSDESPNNLMYYTPQAIQSNFLNLISLFSFQSTFRFQLEHQKKLKLYLSKTTQKRIMLTTSKTFRNCMLKSPKHSNTIQ